MNDIITIASYIGTFVAASVICYYTAKTKIKEFIDNQSNNSHVSKVVLSQSTVDEYILKNMEEVKESIYADRIMIIEFHNGGHYANGRSALKMTATFEVVRAKIERIQKVTSCIPLSIDPTFINTILNEGMIISNDIEDYKDIMPAMYGMITCHDVKSTYNIVIKNSLGNPVGFITAHWNTKTDVSKYEKEMKQLSWYVETVLLNNLPKETNNKKKR